MMVFFMDADENIYARYGGRDSDSADARQSLAGLRYTMQRVLELHRGEQKRFVPVPDRDPFFIRDISPLSALGGCIHCHEAKEYIHAKSKRDGKWTVDELFRFPPPDNLGLTLEVDRGDIVASIEPDSPADRAGLRKGDRIEQIDDFPVMSFGDATFALDRASGEATSVHWLRGGKTLSAKMNLPERWRRTQITWRASLVHMVASPRLFGEDLSQQEKEALGIAAKRLAFRQQDQVLKQARDAGVQPGDIILGFDNVELKMTAYKFLDWVRDNYVAGETVTVNLLRDGRPLNVSMRLLER